MVCSLWSFAVWLHRATATMEPPQKLYGFTIKDFQDECDPMVREIKKTGIKIA